VLVVLVRTGDSSLVLMMWGRKISKMIQVMTSFILKGTKLYSRTPSSFFCGQLGQPKFFF